MMKNTEGETMTKATGTTKFTVGRRGLKCDPRGAQVVMEWQGRTLLGDVTAAYRDDVRGVTHLKVRHFNGEAWPVEPHVLAVDVLCGRNEGGR